MPAVIDIENGTYKAATQIVEHEGKSFLEATRELTYLVISDNLSQLESDILATSGLPTDGQLISGLVCVGREAEETTRITHPVTLIPAALWKVHCKFNNTTQALSDTTPKVRWRGNVEQRAFERDIVTGQRIMTTAGEPIFSTFDRNHPILVVEREESYPFDPLTILTYVHHTNSATFYGAPPATCVMLPIEVDEDRKSNTRICQVTYQIKFILEEDYAGNLIPGTALAWLLNQGYLVRPDKGAKPIKNVDTKGNPVLCNLDQYGRKLEDIEVTDAVLQSVNASYSFIRSPSAGSSQDHVGSLMTIYGSSGFTEGIAYIIGIENISGFLCWVVSGDRGDVGASGGHIIINRAPIYLPFNKHPLVDFNALSLGPY